MINQGMDARQHGGGGRLGKDEFRFGRYADKFKARCWNLTFLPFKNKTTAPPKKNSEAGIMVNWLLGRRIIAATVSVTGRRLSKHRHRVGQSGEQDTSQQCEDVVYVGIATSFETKSVFNVVLRPRELDWAAGSAVIRLW